MAQNGSKSLRNLVHVEKMQTVKSYGDALDSSTSEIIKIIKKPLEGLQTAKIIFLNHVVDFSDVCGV